MQHRTVQEQPSEVRYPYRDRDGKLLFEVVRSWPKRFEVIQPGQGVLAEGIIPHYVLYRLPELLAAPLGENVWFVEGEKDVETLRTEGLVATTNPGGCNHGWQAHYAEDLRDRHVVIVPDADGPGRRLAQAVEQGLRGVAASAVILSLPIHGRDDVSDWLARRRQIPRLLDLAAKARYEAAGIQGKPDKRGLIFASRLSTLEKVVLLGLLHGSTHDGAAKVDVCQHTAGELGRMASCNRVSAQGALTRLEQGGVLRRLDRRRRIFAWDILAVLSIDSQRPAAKPRYAAKPVPELPRRKRNSFDDYKEIRSYQD